MAFPEFWISTQILSHESLHCGSAKCLPIFQIPTKFGILISKGVINLARKFVHHGGLFEPIQPQSALDGGDHPVVIDGQFKGDVTAIDFIIREQGRVTGTVKAKMVVINGQFNGNLICESLNVTATGIVDGEVQANALSIDLGAEVIGSISRVNAKPK